MEKGLCICSLLSEVGWLE